ncbi:LuxR family transcriptional regulator [Parvularcula sp. ZS-1/3]|uniref:LuxR family transcriptional regulator n=1 Tax=Parvularcula mediterranea TaxID=2732508 RepID=A0A7Y3RPD1_9PROT|nr:LuxR family transcriptional regulator [Parvularcula mediterranea]
MPEILEFAENAADCRHSRDLGRLAVDTLKALGIPMMSYHHMPPPGAFDHSPFVSVMASGFPEAWVERYKDRQYYRVDPIPREAMSAFRPFVWSKAAERADLSEDELDYLEELHHAHLGEGIAIPVFGPHGRNGYVGLGSGQEEWPFSHAETTRFHYISQAAHLRYCELLSEALPRHVSLSDREEEILGWIAQGKSNAVMADILSLSPNTVDTYVRRIFRKLMVGDRVTAALRGLALGLIS